MLKQKHSITTEELNITFETGDIAKQANGAVTVTLGETTVFVAATASNKKPPLDQDFFPLTVDYREKFSAAGRFPGGFFKREGRPSEKEILTSRLCDRPLRPLFPKGFLFEVQIAGLLLSTDLKNEADILMVNGASAALAISDIPWEGPIGCVRVGEIDEKFVTNPTHDQQFKSTLDLIYVGNEQEMMMIEGSADQISESRFIEALEYAHKEIQKIITAQKKLAQIVGTQKKTFEPILPDPQLISTIREMAEDRIANAIYQSEKKSRQDDLEDLKEEISQTLLEKIGEENLTPQQISMAFEQLQEELFRKNILENEKRVDGRKPDQLREISCSTGILPRVHGSALFQRGETQSIVITTLGTPSDIQNNDGITGGSTCKSFILHYNFPHYSVGETGRLAGPGRREIGHGALAERSLIPVLPSEEDFPYTIRVVSEIMESNGSTSMASVCGGCLALMDAGVPITEIVTGISIGLVTSPKDNEGKINKHVLLTDIIGSEDHFGDMDFKICGTKHGITGFQLDLKIKGLPFEIAKEAIEQNKKTRALILETMSKEQAQPRKELREHAPRINQMQIDPEKIGALIGPGGKNIRRICENTGAEININEDNSGKVLIYSKDQEAMQHAIEQIELSCSEIEVNKTYKAIVRSVKEFGAFVECLPGKEGLVHISELADFRVQKTEDICNVGDEIWVKCIEIDNLGRARLSRRIAMAEREAIEKGEPIPQLTPVYRENNPRREHNNNSRRRENKGERKPWNRKR
jgi:polyribonucleotide nucleotidyltransferase